MANNYIEEFFISIGFDTAKTKKEAKKIEDILDGVLKKGTSATKAQDGVERKVHKNRMDRFSKQQKAQRQSDGILKNQFREHQKLLKVEARNKPKEKVDQFSKQQQSQRQNDGILKNQFKQQKSILKEEADNIRKEAENLRKAERLAGIDRIGAAKKHERIKKSSAYMKAEDRGLLGSISGSMDRAAAGGQLRSLERLEYQLRKTVSAEAKLERQHKKLNVAQKGLTDSTRNMVRSYASVFALFQGTVAIKRVGQEFEGMRSSMLAASGSAPAAAKDMQFINDMSQEMGLNLKDTTDAFVKFKFAAKGKMDNSEIEDLFTSVSMFGTALKVAPQDMKRAQRALSQMMSKGVIMSEELKMQ